MLAIVAKITFLTTDVRALMSDKIAKFNCTDILYLDLTSFS